MNVWLKKDRNGNFTCGECRKLFKPNPNAVLDFEMPDVPGVYRVFCSKDCAEKFWLDDVKSMEDMQNYKPEFDESGRELI